MKLTADLKAFIHEHEGDNIHQLLLNASRYPDIDMGFIVEQISARRQIKQKLPAWYNNPDLIFPSKISAEQCSSELTALYKQELIHPEDCLCDLTGGLGIDSYYFSRKAHEVLYVERFPDYCRVAAHNFSILDVKNIKVLPGECELILQDLQEVDVFFIDPARRGEGNKRVFALEECEPNLIRLLPVLFQKAPKVIAKISPMADIQQTLALLNPVKEIHVISVKNECKELLFVMERSQELSSPQIICSNFTSEGKLQKFQFNYEEEKSTYILCSESVKKYLYEPNSSILKAGAFKTVVRCGAEKLHIHSHLYTSDQYLAGFPGRIFQVEEVIPFHNKTIKSLKGRYPRANITVRNFPLSVAELRKRSKIAEGGDSYLFATTLQNGDKVLIHTLKA